MRDPGVYKEANKFDRIVNNDPIGVQKRFGKGKDSDPQRK
jgi:hypothetical protein